MDNFRLARLKIAKQLKELSEAKIARDRILVPVASKQTVQEIAAVTREIRRREIPQRFVLKRLKGKLGYGLFLHPEAKPIARGEAIAPYSGVAFLAPQTQDHPSNYIFSLFSGWRLTKEEQQRFDPANRYHPRRFYSLDLDAEKNGNFTRFINHSDQPNIEADLIRIPTNSLGLKPGPFEMVYFAKKKIRPGEQLLICYDGDDKSYWGACGIKPFAMKPNTFVLNAILEVVEKKKRPG